MHDFFVSYNKADKDWATWIAWQLEDAGKSTVIQDWDFRPGENFVLKMQDALTTSQQTIMVLSENYLKSSFTAPEWAAVFASDPTAAGRKLVPIRVRECKPDGLLASLIYVDLVGLSEDAARAALLGGFGARSKPATSPTFPGNQKQPPEPPASFPGSPDPAMQVAPVTIGFVPSASKAGLSFIERLQLVNQLNALLPSQFNILIFALGPPNGLIPPMPAPQADRSTALLSWAESPTGHGLQAVKEALQYLLNPS
jgi:hypothetical protein